MFANVSYFKNPFALAVGSNNFFQADFAFLLLMWNWFHVNFAFFKPHSLSSVVSSPLALPFLVYLFPTLIFISITLILTSSQNLVQIALADVSKFHPAPSSTTLLPLIWDTWEWLSQYQGLKAQCTHAQSCIFNLL